MTITCNKSSNAWAIRKATVDDISSIISATESIWSNTVQTPDFSKIISELRTGIVRFGGFVVEENNQLVGCLIFNKISCWWTSEKLLTNLFFWVDKPNQSYKIVRSLYRLAIALSAETKTPLYIEKFAYDKINGRVSEGKMVWAAKPPKQKNKK